MEPELLARTAGAMRRARMLSRWRLSWVKMSAACSISLDKVRGNREPVISTHQQLVGETLGEVDGVALIDESSVVKQGNDSVWGGLRNTVDRWAKLRMVSGGTWGTPVRKRYSLIEGRLFLPDEWFDEGTCTENAVPVVCQKTWNTRPSQKIGLGISAKRLPKRGRFAPFHMRCCG